MSRTAPARNVRRGTAVTAIAAAAVLALAGPAAAHVEVEAEGARALDQNVTLTFLAESESDQAGIAKLQVYLPKGLTPADVTYEEGPKGWTFERGTDNFAVSGPAVALGRDAEFAVTVRQLPDAKSLTFKTLQTYGDGRIDRWIELEEPGEHSHEDETGHGNPAPVLVLKPAAAEATPVPASPSASPSSEAPSQSPEAPPSASATAPASDEAAADETVAGDDGSSPAVPLIIGAVVLAALGGGAWWWTRRRNADA